MNTEEFKEEQLLVFGYIRHELNAIEPQLFFPDSIVKLICYSYYFQQIGTFFVIFESYDIEQDSFIKTYDISNQWEYLRFASRKTHINHKNHFIKSHENSFCMIPWIKTNTIPGINKSVINNLDTINTSNVIYRVGGLHSITNKYVDIGCIFDNNIIFELPQINTKRYGNRTVYSKKYGLLTVGGCGMMHNYLSSVEQLVYNDNDNDMNDWYWNNQFIANMMSLRFCPSVIILNNGKYDEKLFVIGGKVDDMNDLNICEMYSFQENKWINIASMNYVRNSAGICEWNKNNKNIVVVGGYNGESSKSVEHYDLYKDKWYILPNTNTAHKNCCGVTVYYDINPYFKSNNGILVVFGNDGTSKADWGFIEYYDHREWKQKWNIIKRVNQCIPWTDNTDFLWILTH